MQLMFMTSSNMLSSNNFIYTFENIISVLYCTLYTAIFNVSRITLITGHLQKLAKENLVKHGFRIPQDMSQADNSNKVSLPVAGEHSSFLYAIYKVFVCNFV